MQSAAAANFRFAFLVEARYIIVMCRQWIERRFKSMNMKNEKFRAAWLRGELTPAVFLDIRPSVIAIDGIIISKTTR